MDYCCICCRYLVRTSPEQRFWLCRFWSAKQLSIPSAASRLGKRYVVTHCHMQPTARACPFFVARRGDLYKQLSAHELERLKELTDKKLTETLSRYSADLYAEFTRMSVKQLRTYANQRHVPLGGASSRTSIIQEIVGQLRHRKYVELTGEDG